MPLLPRARDELCWSRSGDGRAFVGIIRRWGANCVQGNQLSPPFGIAGRTTSMRKPARLSLWVRVPRSCFTNASRIWKPKPLRAGRHLANTSIGDDHPKLRQGREDRSFPNEWCRSEASGPRLAAWSSCHHWQTDGCSIADRTESFQGHGASLHPPFVVLREQDGANEADDRGLVGKERRPHRCDA